MDFDFEIPRVDRYEEQEIGDKNALHLKSVRRPLRKHIQFAMITSETFRFHTPQNWHSPLFYS